MKIILMLAVLFITLCMNYFNIQDMFDEFIRMKGSMKVRDYFHKIVRNVFKQITYILLLNRCFSLKCYANRWFYWVW